MVLLSCVETSTVTVTIIYVSTVTVTNRLNAVSPTGVSFRFAPYLMMLLCGVALMLLNHKKKRV